MNFEQIGLFSLFFAVFALLLSGKLRYDVIAFSALVVAVMTGLVPHEKAFSGFGHEATIIVALVLVISRGLINSGAVDLITRTLIDSSRRIGAHIAVMSGLGATLSAFMNNVAALALLMPVDLAAARKSERSPALTLMPLSFATILGGLATLIGTPPNIIIAAYRERALGESYAMFDFAPVGIACTIAGVAFITLIGWRLIPQARGETDTARELSHVHGFIAELVVNEKSPLVGAAIADMDDDADSADVALIGLVRNGRRLPGNARAEDVADTLIEYEFGRHPGIDAADHRRERRLPPCGLLRLLDQIAIDAVAANEALVAGLQPRQRIRGRRRPLAVLCHNRAGSGLGLGARRHETRPQSG